MTGTTAPAFTGTGAIARAQKIVEALACGKPGCPCGKANSLGTGLTHCPTHDDAKPSLSVGVKGGKAMVFCFTGCCTQEAVLDALRERGLWPTSKGNGRRIVATYAYHDAAGHLLYETVRYQPKDFRQRQPDGNGGWTWNLDGVDRVLYGLPGLLAAAREKIIYIVEGEADCDRLASLGLIASTNVGGAGKWKDEYSECLRGRNVAILPDNDDAGHHHADQVVTSVTGIAATVNVIKLPDLSERQDVSNWLDAGHTVEELMKLVASHTEAPEEPLSAAPEDGAALLDEVADFIRRYVVLTPHQCDACSLWTAHTHTFDAANFTPYESVTSPEKRSGKTRLLEVQELLVARPWLTGRVTPAVLVRKVDRDRPTLLLDESDAAFKGAQEYAEALRAVLNTGHRRGGVASLCVKAGGDFDLKDFATFCPKAIAGIGKLPDTVADRAIIISLKRRAPTEPIERLRRSVADGEAKPIREGLATWAATHIDELRELHPEIPDGLDDRAVDGWEVLIAIADVAGGDWPRRARVAALALSSGDAREDESSGVRLLADIKSIFENRGVDRLPSVEMCHALNFLEESPWGDWKGKPLDPRGLARLLRPFGIRVTVVRIGATTSKGYPVEGFADAFGRYLPCVPVGEVTTVTRVTDGESESGDVTDVTDVTPPKDMQEGASVDPQEEVEL